MPSSVHIRAVEKDQKAREEGKRPPQVVDAYREQGERSCWRKQDRPKVTSKAHCYKHLDLYLFPSVLAALGFFSNSLSMGLNTSQDITLQPVALPCLCSSPSLLVLGGVGPA